MKAIHFYSVFLVLICAASTGCVTNQVHLPRYSVAVDSICADDAGINNSYILLPGNKDVSPDDLLFLEFSQYIHRALKVQGFVKALNVEDASIAVFLCYGVGDPKEHQYTYSVPVFGQTGYSSRQTFGNFYSFGNMATYQANTTYTPSYGVVGASSRLGTYVTYTRYISLAAYDMDEYKLNNKEKQVWRTGIISIGLLADMRRVFPIMIGAATAFIGRNSGHIVTINLCENDSRVYLVKGTEPKPINEIPVSSYTLSSEVLPSGKTYKWKSE